jgi:hypothetical protein
MSHNLTLQYTLEFPTSLACHTTLPILTLQNIPNHHQPTDPIHQTLPHLYPPFHLLSLTPLMQALTTWSTLIHYPVSHLHPHTQNTIITLLTCLHFIFPHPFLLSKSIIRFLSNTALSLSHPNLPTMFQITLRISRVTTLIQVSKSCGRKKGWVWQRITGC